MGELADHRAADCCAGAPACTSVPHAAPCPPARAPPPPPPGCCPCCMRWPPRTMSTGAVTVVVTRPASPLTASRGCQREGRAGQQLAWRLLARPGQPAPAPTARRRRSSAVPARGSSASQQRRACEVRRQVVLPAQAPHKQQLQLVVCGALRRRQQRGARLRTSAAGEQAKRWGQGWGGGAAGGQAALGCCSGDAAQLAPPLSGRTPPHPAAGCNSPCWGWCPPTGRARRLSAPRAPARQRGRPVHRRPFASAS